MAFSAMMRSMSTMDQVSPKKELLIGILIVCIARLAMALVVVFSRFAIKDISMAEIIFFQNVIALLCLLPFLIKFDLKSLKEMNYWHLGVRIVFGLLGFVFLLLSAQQISLTGAILLNNASPLFVPFVVLIWRKVPINHRLWVGIITGFVGVALVLQPWKVFLSSSKLQMELGMLYGLLSGICLSIAMVSMRVLRFSKMIPILCSYYVFASITTLLPALYEWSMPSLLTWGFLIGMGALTLVAQWGYLKAFRYGKASHISPFFFVAVIYGALFDWLFFDATPNLFVWLGSILLICGSILVILMSGSKQNN